MAQFDDISLTRTTAPDLPPPRSGPPLWPAIVVVLFALGAGAWWYFQHRRPAPAAQGVAQTTVNLPKESARPTAEPGEAIDLPPLDQTDAIVRTLVSRLSSHPRVAAWLTTKGLIRNIAVVIVNVANGETPAAHLLPLKPSGKFVVRPTNGRTLIDAASYRRYDGVGEAVQGLDARGVARFYATVKPRLVEAFGDLGVTNAEVDRTVERAIVLLLRTPIVDRDVQVVPVKVSYAFAEPGLEALPPAQRQFLRMGPRNVRIVKAKLREVAHYLGIPDTALPPPDAA
jgi:Protein of unknown function (DUF3014)